MSRVLITGCSTGIGRATAVELGGRGYDVIATARNIDSIQDLDAVERLQLDVTDDHSVRAAVEAAGRIDVLVNNAGVGCWGPIEMIPFADVHRLVDTNVLGVIRMLQAVLPGMRELGNGAIVNVSSAAGRNRGSAALGYYTMTKHSVEILSEALRHEVGPFGIRVISVEPGAIASNFPNNRIVNGLDGPPYESLGRAFKQRMQASRSEAYPASTVAQVIADALEEERPVLRRAGSPDAVAMIEASAKLDERTAEARYWENFGSPA